MKLSLPSWLSSPSPPRWPATPVLADRTGANGGAAPIDRFYWPKAAAIRVSALWRDTELRAVPVIAGNPSRASAAAGCCAGAAFGLSVGTWPTAAVLLVVAAAGLGRWLWRAHHAPAAAPVVPAPATDLAPAPAHWQEILQSNARAYAHLQSQLQAEKTRQQAHSALMRQERDALQQRVQTLQSAAERQPHAQRGEQLRELQAELARAHDHQRKSDKTLDRLTTAKSQLQKALVEAKETSVSLETSLGELQSEWAAEQKTYTRQAKKDAAKLREAQAQIRELTAKNDDLESTLRDARVPQRRSPPPL